MPCDTTSAPALTADTIVTLPPHAAEWVNQRLADVARRARRSGVDEQPHLAPVGEPRSEYEPTASTDEMLDCLNEIADGRGGFVIKCGPGLCPRHWRETIVQDFRVCGVMPVLPGGWRLLAAVDHTPLGAVIREAPGSACPADHRGANASDRCDHCGVSRKRKTCYVLRRGDDDKVMQVGSGCVAEYLRDTDVEKTVEIMLRMQAIWLDFWARVADGEIEPGGGGRRDEPKPLHELLSHVAAYTRKNHGVYVTRKQAEASGDALHGQRCSSTVDLAWACMNARSAEEKKSSPDLRTAADLATATAAVAWAASLPVDGSTFEQNMRLFGTSRMYTPKHRGTAAYIVPAYLRATSQAGSYPVRPGPPPVLEAVVGATVTREVEIVRIASFDSDFGTRYITAMRVLPTGTVTGTVGGDPPDVGAIVKWKSGQTPTVRSAHWTGQLAADLTAGTADASDRAFERGADQTSAKAGDRVVIQFKVKSHGEYKGSPETDVTHVKCVCDGWGFRTDASPAALELAARMIAEGRNAPPAPAPKAKRTRKAKAAKPSEDTDYLDRACIKLAHDAARG